MSEITSFSCSKCCTDMWYDRAVGYFHKVNEITLITSTPKDAFKEGFLQTIGPTAKEISVVFTLDTTRTAETSVFKKALIQGAYSSRADVCFQCFSLPACCIIDETKNAAAILVDTCVAPYFCWKRTNDGFFFCGAAFGDCFNIPKDCVYYGLKSLYLPFRFCFFDTIGPGKQNCIPFPMVDEVLYSADCQQCCREGKTWSEEARQVDRQTISRQPQSQATTDRLPHTQKPPKDGQVSS